MHLVLEFAGMEKCFTVFPHNGKNAQPSHRNRYGAQKNGWLEVLHFATQQRMKKKTKPAKKSPYTVLHQICNLNPPLLVPRSARQNGVDAKSRMFSPWRSNPSAFTNFGSATVL